MTQDISAILLPPSRVDVFAMDAATSATAGALSSDWRFARVGMDVVQGGIDAAIDKYAQTPSPELVIIETNDISDAFTARLGDLAQVCAEGTDAVIIGPTNDVHLYRSLVGMGVRDYLVRPVSAGDVAGVIARALVDKRGLADSRLIAVIGGKGGVGATMTAQALAWLVAEALGEKTVLADAASGTGSLGVAYGVEPVTTLAEAARLGRDGSDDDMRRILQTASDNLSLLVFGGDAVLGDDPDPDAVEALFTRVMQKNPVVVVDLSGAAHPVQRRLISCAAHVVVVTSPQVTALRNCRTLITEIKHHRSSLDNLDLVLNMQGMPAAEEVPAAEIVKALGVEAAAKLPYAPKLVMASEMTGKPLGKNKAAQAWLENLMPVALRAAGRKDKPARGGAGKKGMFDFLKGSAKQKG